MKNLLIIILVSLITLKQIATGEALASPKGEQVINVDKVIIAPNAIIVPLNRILLIRKKSVYCGVKFTDFWAGKTEEDWFAKYESYYQDDKTGDFTNKNVQFIKGELASPKPRGIGRFAFSLGKKEIQCGPIKLYWSGKGSVYFYRLNQDEGDYGIELAPTIWTDISQVNVFDPRIKWYRYDEKRQRVNIPIDQLWESGEIDKK